MQENKLETVEEAKYLFLCPVSLRSLFSARGTHRSQSPAIDDGIKRINKQIAIVKCWQRLNVYYYHS